jgi:hypothetical protein
MSLVWSGGPRDDDGWLERLERWADDLERRIAAWWRSAARAER